MYKRELEVRLVLVAAVVVAASSQLSSLGTHVVQQSQFLQAHCLVRFEISVMLSLLPRRILHPID